MRLRETTPQQPPVAGLQQIDAACDRFESAWRAGQAPDLASYLAEAPVELRLFLFRDLVRLDLEYRRERGEQPDALFYASRFPEFESELATALQSRAASPEKTGGSGPTDWGQAVTVDSPTAVGNHAIGPDRFRARRAARTHGRRL